ncbi:ribonuclease H-like domain-containing protein [Ferdinandcohnia quinoae]|uniref:Ribonuclease H-like domain-containing protein n=1 Tax=Fredinandcohnia quinoae TaxID=2918902 RepID=A0AAW5EDV1_9BACI|nr:ribonuclease H-like domain-containing protein [Fredinandcohnia sp. SECRCQ15]MCH1627333.1 ribonuclease H-like domain-containing protein [Fredinandcohnia sp. SECRCQ15]
MSIKGKLNRYKNHIVKEVDTAFNKKLIHTSMKDHEIPFLEKWRSFGAEPFYFDGSFCFVRTVDYPLDYQHGIYPFSKLANVVDMWNSQGLNHPLSTNGHKMSDLFFFDTETTGLGGGAGNTIFLLGHARVQKDRIILKQHFLPNPGAEVALYQSFLSIVDYKTLVTYNGKAFDWPQVKTRHTLIRDAIPKLPEFGHFDLYHASRRLWKNKLESVRLANVEKEILGIKRVGDVPGFLAPILYFDYLDNQDPEGIFGILQHNEIDILSLISLYIHLSGIILQSESNDNISEQFEVAKWLDTLGETKKAESLYEQVAEHNELDVMKAKLALAFLYKKQNKVDESIHLFHEIFEIGFEGEKVISGIELSKHYEHRVKDFKKALSFASSSFEYWKNQKGERKKKEEVDFVKRLNRLERKFQKEKEIFPG